MVRIKYMMRRIKLNGTEQVLVGWYIVDEYFEGEYERCIMLDGPYQSYNAAENDAPCVVGG